MNHVNSLEALREFIGPCSRCKLCEARKNVVFGVGDPKAELMFVGEGPGADEDEQGIPFVGRAGKLLTDMIAAMKMTRDEVYIANIVKCRPPGNRNPEPDEIATCIPFLLKQISLVRPKVVVCLGKIASQALLNSQIPITKLRGRFQDMNGTAVMPTYHPAFLLRNPPMKKFVWEDLQQVMKKLGKS
jgi:DNA polymerase